MHVHCARDELQRRLARRELDFLTLARRCIYGSADSPIRHLLAAAGCELGDLERLVANDGLEGALRELYQRGVYLSMDEVKGGRPVVRGSTSFHLDQQSLRNPLVFGSIEARSSGSSHKASLVPISPSFIRDRAVDSGLVLAARGGAAWLNAVWGVPGGAAVIRMLEFSAFGSRPVRWFSQLDPAAPGVHPRYRWSARAIRWGSILAAAPLPASEYVPIDDPAPIVRWMADTLRAGRTPHLHTYASSAVRVCLAARASGVELRGAQFTMSSEPITAARLAVVAGAGGQAEPCYASIECGPIGYGCLNRRSADDMHLLADLHAVIQPGSDSSAGHPADALLLTSLRTTAPLILLNVELGDQASVDARRCGCPLERLGWTVHLESIRSYHKLTAGGMTFLDLDIIRILEDVLPTQFGGAPTHYQLIEEESDDAQPRLRLLVHPAVGAIDPARVAECFFGELATSDATRVMEQQWRQAGWLEVERRAPITTANGKIQHLQRQPQPAAAKSPLNPLP